MVTRMSEMQGRIEAARTALANRLADVASGFGTVSPGLGAAMAGAVLAPGKRFRGTLMLLAGRSSPALVDAACAVELLHTASLIFDDLPCMDDARLRRGRPATHAQHGEATAILAGIALVTEAMRLTITARNAPADVRAALTECITAAVGPGGLCAGQELDLHGAKTSAGVRREQELKTGALFVCGFHMLAEIEAIEPRRRNMLTDAGLRLGRSFQTYDDLLDLAASPAETGKDVGQDAGRRGLMATRLSPTQAIDRYREEREGLFSTLATCLPGGVLTDYIAAVLPDRVAVAA